MVGNRGGSNGKPYEYLGHFRNLRVLKVGHNTGGKVEKVMHEFKHGALRSGSKHGPVVKSHKQAVAIALSEARKGKQQ